MTVTVTVKARAHGATLTVDGEPITVAPNSEQRFQVEPGTPLTLTANEPAEAPTDNADLPLDPNDVPGRAQNDALLGQEAAVEEAAAVDADAAPAPASDADEPTKPRRGFRD